MMNARMQKSIEQYRRVIDHAQQLDQLLAKGDSERLQAYIARLHALQTEAGLYDRELLEEIARDSARWQAHPLFQERMQLLKQIMEMNDSILPKIYALKAITATELDQLRGGRVAVSGYGTTLKKDHKVSRGVS